MISKEVKQTVISANYWVHLALCLLCAGAFLSIPLMSLSQLCAAISIILFYSHPPAPKKYGLPKSAWVLIFFAFSLALSTLINNPWHYSELVRPLTKLRYYIIPALFIAPLYYYLQDITAARLKLYVYILLVASIIGNVAGIYTFFSDGYNPLKLTFNTFCAIRNCGMFDTMTYSHSSVFLGLFLLWLFNRTHINKKLIICAALVFIAGFYLSFTVGAWLALGTGIAFYYVKNIKKTFAYLLVLTLVITLIFSLPITQNARPKYGYSQSVRIGLWQASWIALKTHPLTGIGFLNFEKQSTLIKKQHTISHPDFQGHSHSNYFQFFSEGGLLSGFLLLGWMATWIQDLRKRQDEISFIGYAAVAAVAVSSLTQSTLIFAGNCSVIFMIYSITLAYPALPSPKPSTHPN